MRRMVAKVRMRCKTNHTEKIQQKGDALPNTSPPSDGLAQESVDGKRGTVRTVRGLENGSLFGCEFIQNCFDTLWKIGLGVGERPR